MPTLRQIVDGKTLECQAAKPSPAAKHVAEHVQDPFNKTKDSFDDLNQARMDYETKKQNMRMQLAPVQQVVQGIKNMHQLDGPGDGSPLDMSPNNPANMQPQIDPATGQPMVDPNTGLPLPNTPNAPGAQIDQNGVPQNMSQTTGQMNMNRPSQAGFQPGVSPGPEQSVRPGKMGTPQAGQPGASKVAGNPNPGNMPAGWTKPGSGGTGNQPGQFNPAAPPPKGNRSMPGAKGPGDPKVANRTKKAQANSGGGSGRSVHVEVRADSMLTSPATSTVARAAAADMLRRPVRAVGPKCPKCGKIHADGVKACNDMKGVGTSEGVRKGWLSRLRRTQPDKPGGVTGPTVKNKYGEDIPADWKEREEEYEKDYDSRTTMEAHKVVGGVKDAKKDFFKKKPDLPLLGMKAKMRKFPSGIKARLTNLTQ